MRLGELLEEQSIKSISQRTMISEENIQRILNEDYSEITKAKALGFLSILEREFKLDLKDVRNNAISYFELNRPKEDSVNIALPRVEEKKGRTKWFLFLILGLLAYASWYFFTQFDKKTISSLVPFGAENNATQKANKTEEKEKRSIFSVAINEETTKETQEPVSQEHNLAQNTIDTKVQKDDSVPARENISSIPDTSMTKADANATSNVTVVSEAADIETVQKEENTTNHTAIAQETTDENISTQAQADTAQDSQTNTNKIIPEVLTVPKAIIKPEKRLWFGLVNMRTGKKDHFSVRKPYTIDLSKGNWLVATSPAPFSLVFNGETKSYKNGRAHYFMITKSGITPLDKRAYVRKGGYRKW